MSYKVKVKSECLLSTLWYAREIPVFELLLLVGQNDCGRVVLRWKYTNIHQKSFKIFLSFCDTATDQTTSRDKTTEFPSVVSETYRGCAAH